MSTHHCIYNRLGGPWGGVFWTCVEYGRPGLTGYTPGDLIPELTTVKWCEKGERVCSITGVC